MERLPNWDQYYGLNKIRPFERQEISYLLAINNLRTRNPNLLNPNQPAVIVLGGCAAQRSKENAISFQQLCKFLHPQPTSIILDQNIRPLRQPLIGTPLQTDLAYPPFAPRSIDLLMLDFTPEYLSDSQLSQLAESFALCLKPHGAILVANSTHLLHKLESILQTHNNGVITTIRGTQKLASLLKTHFKITSIGIADHHELITLTLKGSQYPTFIQPQYPIEYGEDSQISRQLRIIFQKYKSTLPNYPTT